MFRRESGVENAVKESLRSLLHRLAREMDEGELRRLEDALIEALKRKRTKEPSEATNH